MSESAFSRVAYSTLGNPAYLMPKFQRELEVSIRRGEGAGELAKRLLKVCDMPKYRAARIAQTERTRAMNRARWEALMELNKTRQHKTRYRKMWITKKDERVRSSHKGMSGQMQFVSTPFETDAGNLLQYPGDESAPAEEVINCRCYMRRVNPEDVKMYEGKG